MELRIQQQGKVIDYTGLTFIEKMQMKCAYVAPYEDPFNAQVDTKKLREPVLPLSYTKAANITFADDTKEGKGETPKDQKDPDYKPAILKKYQGGLYNIQKIAQQEYTRVAFLGTEKGQGPITDKEEEFQYFPSKIGTRLVYSKKDQQNYYENLKEKAQKRAEQMAVVSASNKDTA